MPIIIMMIGCAPGAKITIAKTTTDNDALLYVFRPSCAPIALEPTVFINDIEVAELYNDGYFYIELKPGKYHIKILWSFVSGVRPQSTVIELIARPGTVHYIRVYTHMNMAGPRLSPIYVSENNASIIDTNKSLPFMGSYRLIGKRPGVENIIMPQ